jgi:hypothetical protein
MPPDTVYVGRSSAMWGDGVFGNPFICTRSSHCCKDDPEESYCCVEAFEEYVRSGLENRMAYTGTVRGSLMASTGYLHRNNLVKRLPELRGKNLACWCSLDRPCHADVLLRLANAPLPPAQSLPSEPLENKGGGQS